MVSPFEVLQVDPSADEETIEAAYRERVKEAHPDHGGSPAAFRLVRLAYEEIQDHQPAAPDGPPEPAAPDRDRTDGPPGRRYERPSRQRDGSGSDRRTPTDTDRQEPRWSNRWRGRVRAHVEYLDYDALDDHGWSLGDDDLFEKATAANLDPGDHGEVLVEPGSSLLEAAEDAGFAWPFSCRGGACANCAVAVVEGELEMPVNHILPPEMLDRGIQLSCNGTPGTDEMQVVYNIKNLPYLDELRLPPRPFEQAYVDD